MRTKLGGSLCYSDNVPCTETVLSWRGYIGGTPLGAATAPKVGGLAVTQVERNRRAPSRETAYRTAYQASFRRRNGAA